MSDEINENLKKISTWKRIFFMLIFAVIIGLVRILLWAVILLQVASTLLTGSCNSNILTFGKNLSVYLYHILLFMTFAGDQLPFPFSNWSFTEEVEVIDRKQNS